jgi:hypothetical protein
MDSKKRHDLLKQFLCQYKKTALAFVLFGIIYATVFSLYDLELEAVLYAFALCALAAVIMIVIAFWQNYRAYQERQQILQEIEYRYEQLPKACTLAEEDYRQMIFELGQMNNARQTEWKQAQQESLEYYTTWIHQIKVPIAVMQMNLQGEDTKEHRELLAELFRIEQYVDMVLTYIRLGSNQTDFVIQEYDIDAIIRQAIHKYAQQFIRRKIRLIYEPTPMKVLTDEKWLLFILEQLLSNAIKYTPKGSITIQVLPDGVISISDTGIGIAPEDLPRIFEKGFTGYNGRADKKATGLGLYLCKQTADKLGISLRAESELGKGSTFSLFLK